MVTLLYYNDYCWKTHTNRALVTLFVFLMRVHFHNGTLYSLQCNVFFLTAPEHRQCSAGCILLSFLPWHLSQYICLRPDWRQFQVSRGVSPILSPNHIYIRGYLRFIFPPFIFRHPACLYASTYISLSNCQSLLPTAIPFHLPTSFINPPPTLWVVAELPGVRVASWNHLQQLLSLIPSPASQPAIQPARHTDKHLLYSWVPLQPRHCITESSMLTDWEFYLTYSQMTLMKI